MAVARAKGGLHGLLPPNLTAEQEARLAELHRLRPALCELAKPFGVPALPSTGPSPATPITILPTARPSQLTDGTGHRRDPAAGPAETSQKSHDPGNRTATRSKCCHPDPTGRRCSDSGSLIGVLAETAAASPGRAWIG